VGRVIVRHRLTIRAIRSASVAALREAVGGVAQRYRPLAQ
jgi:hypothetical protein